MPEDQLGRTAIHETDYETGFFWRQLFGDSSMENVQQKFGFPYEPSEHC